MNRLSYKQAMVAAMLLLPLFLGAKALAEPAYISERLYLGLYAAPDATTEPIKTLPSGTSVEVLQRLGDYARLRLTDGTEGWARAEFISKEPPAKLLVKELTVERDRLRQQLETVSNDNQQKTLKQQLVKANQKITELNEQLNSGESEAASVVQEQKIAQQQFIDNLKTQLTNSERMSTELQAELAELKKVSAITQTATQQSNIPMKVLWLLVAMFSSLCMGIYIGMRWLSRRVRRRFNGLKVW